MLIATACDKRPALETTVDRKSVLDGGTNYGKGEQLWQPYMGTIGGAMFGPAGPLAARTTYGVTESTIGLTHKTT